MRIIDVDPRIFREADDSKDDNKVMGIIKDLGDSFGKDKESKMKGAQLLKGLLLSDDPKAKEFVDALDKFTTAQSNKMTS